MRIYKLIKTILLAMVWPNAMTTATAATTESVIKRERAMDSSNDKKGQLTNEQVEAAVTEAEKLYKRGENAKAATILIQIMEKTDNDPARALMAMVILDKPLPPELALRFVHASNGNEGILNELLRKTKGQLPAAITKEIIKIRDKDRSATHQAVNSLKEVQELYERNGPSPDAEAAIMKIIESSPNDDTRIRAVWIICHYRLRPELALRIARTAKDSETFFALLSKTAALPKSTVRELMTWIVMNGFLDGDTRFTDMAESGVISDDFVPSVFTKANGKTRYTLLGLAYAQLCVRSNDQLHRFMVSVMFGNYPQEIRDNAGIYLANAYDMNQKLEVKHFRIELASIKRFFGTVPEFSSRMNTFLTELGPIRGNSLPVQHLTNAFSETDPHVVPAFIADKAATSKLVRALDAVVADNKSPEEVREAMQAFLGILRSDPSWHE